MKKEITLNRNDFKDANAEVDFFNDYVLDNLNIPKKFHDRINEVNLIIEEDSWEACTDTDIIDNMTLPDLND